MSDGHALAVPLPQLLTVGVLLSVGSGLALLKREGDGVRDGQELTVLLPQLLNVDMLLAVVEGQALLVREGKGVRDAQALTVPLPQLLVVGELLEVSVGLALGVLEVAGVTDTRAVALNRAVGDGADEVDAAEVLEGAGEGEAAGLAEGLPEGVARGELLVEGVLLSDQVEARVVAPVILYRKAAGAVTARLLLGHVRGSEPTSPLCRVMLSAPTTDRPAAMVTAAWSAGA